jgi:hypothetical protein
MVVAQPDLYAAATYAPVARALFPRQQPRVDDNTLDKHIVALFGIVYVNFTNLTADRRWRKAISL